MFSLEQEDKGIKKMWRMCICRAMLDYVNHVTSIPFGGSGVYKAHLKNTYHESAKKWINSDADGIGSFRYACMVIDEPRWIFRDALKRAGVDEAAKRDLVNGLNRLLRSWNKDRNYAELESVGD